MFSRSKFDLQMGHPYRVINLRFRVDLWYWRFEFLSKEKMKRSRATLTFILVAVVTKIPAGRLELTLFIAGYRHLSESRSEQKSTK